MANLPRLHGAQVTWAHVGNLEHDADRLRRIAVMTFNEGEHAA
jgi:hypothetical protein